MSEIKRIHEPAREIPVRAETDILVVGGGPTGIIAAWAAANQGKKVMLIESRGFLGGNLVLGLPLNGFLGRKGNQVIWGLPQKFVDRLKALGGATEHRPCPLHVSLTMIDPDLVGKVSWGIMEENHIDVLMYVFFTDVIMDGDKVKGVIIDSKAGREAILAKEIIDCTGDADVAFRAGVPCQKGNEGGHMQPPSLMFDMRGVDMAEFRKEIADHPEKYESDTIPNEFFREDKNFVFVGMRQQIIDAREHDGLDLPVDRTIIVTGMKKDEAWINMSRVNGVDSTKPESYTYGEEVSIKQNEDVVKYLKKYVPGFENAWVDKTTPFLGIRESRRIEGEYMMTADDILKCRRFDDAIAVAAYPIDLHHPIGGDCTLEWCSDCYDIPYRCLVPKKVTNLLVAGRCASMTHEAMASTRVMPICMAMGEAAGKAAAIAANDGVPVQKVDVAKLQKQLREEGAYLRD
jgi:hypothetical protein